MSARKIPFDEVQIIVSSNKLRQYPSAKKGKSRLLPYARPQITNNTKIPVGGTFFVVGNCFARNIEKSLGRAGRTFLSSPNDLDLPGSAMEQYGRYNIFNLDVSTNEIEWVRDPDGKKRDSALIEVEGEWVDMQIHWTFAHPEKEAKKFRRVYNGGYAKIYEADTVIVSVSGITQWFDKQADHYMNIMPTRRMTQDSPDRFELHQFDVEACADSLRRFCDLVLKNSTKNPMILVVVSPVSQPAVLSTEDALIDQTLAKSTQRVAAQLICDEYERVEYLPFLESALLSDFRYAYRDSSPNHTTQGFANRVVADMLLSYEGPSEGATLLGAIGHTEALLFAKDFEGAIAYAKTAIKDGVRSDELDLLYDKALRGAGQHAISIDYLIDQLSAGVVIDPERHMREVLNLSKNIATADQIDKFRQYLKVANLDEKPLNEMLVKRHNSAGVKGANAEALITLKGAAREQCFADVIEQGKALLEAKDPLDSAGTEIVLVLMSQAMSKDQDHSKAVDLLLEQAEKYGPLTTRLVQTLVNLAKFHADITSLNAILKLQEIKNDPIARNLLTARLEKLKLIASNEKKAI
ncbi:MAG: hypothetical protein ACI84R_002472 [Candidatus Azotimanducaceae bacterium]|jgi:hypothetical protein